MSEVMSPWEARNPSVSFSVVFGDNEVSEEWNVSDNE